MAETATANRITLEEGIARLRPLAEQEQETDVRRGRVFFQQGDVVVQVLGPDARLIASEVGGWAGRTTDEEKRFVALAAGAGIAPDALAKRYDVARAVPPERRGRDVSWSVFLEVIACTHGKPDERASLLELVVTPNPETVTGRWTVPSLRRVLVQRGLRSGTGSMLHRSESIISRLEVEDTPKKLETLKHLLTDPAVLEAATDARTPVGGLLFGVAAEQREQTATRARQQEAGASARFEHDPIDQAVRNARAITLLTSVLSDYARGVAELLPEIRALPETDRESLGARLFLREAYARAQGATEQVGAVLTTGRVGGDVDEFLKSVLGESRG